MKIRPHKYVSNGPPLLVKQGGKTKIDDLIGELSNMRNGGAKYVTLYGEQDNHLDFYFVKEVRLSPVKPKLYNMKFWDNYLRMDKIIKKNFKQ